MKHSILVTMLFLTACMQKTEKKLEITPDLQPYLELFEKEAQKVGYPIIKVDNLIMIVEEIDPKLNGNCQINPNATPLIRISKKYWEILKNMNNEYAEYLKRDIVFHELGHCILFRGHKDEKHGDNKASIMYYTSIVYLPYYKEHWDEYIKELFWERN